MNPHVAPDPGRSVEALPRSARELFADYVTVARKGTGAIWSRVKRWFIAAAAVGALTGLAVTGIHYLTYELLWDALSQRIDPVTAVAFPAFGLFLSGIVLQRFSRRPDLHGTEEVIDAYHEREGRVDLRSAPAKILAAVATVGFGGSAGLEGPSIHVGGAIGTWVFSRLERWGFGEQDARTLMVAGAAAGISAVFKAPVTGIVFALEVPYMDDLAREALIPSLIASASSYLVLVRFLGVRPLFLVSERYVLELRDLPYALLLGLVIGIIARLFIASFHMVRRVSERSRLPLWVRTTAGGAACGVAGIIGLKVFGSPIVLGTGYEAIGELVAGRYGPLEAFWLMILKTGAVLATLGSGAAGGLFIPVIMIGAEAGSALRGLFPEASGPLFPIAGMAAFLAAAYNAPLAATVFIAESTGGAGYIIPGLLAAAVSYTVAGRVSIAPGQRWRREEQLDRMLRLTVGDIMTREVVGVPAGMTVSRFVEEYVIGMRRKSFPVIEDGRLAGMISLSDVRDVPRERRRYVRVGAVMARNLVTAAPDEPVGTLVERMAEGDIDRVPVVDAADPDRMVGIVSVTDVLALDEVSSRWRARRERRPLGG